MSRFERRLAALEAEVLLLKQRLADKSGKPWWQEIAGRFANDPVYDEAMRLGRKYRESQRPKSARGRGHDRSGHRSH